MSLLPSDAPRPRLCHVIKSNPEQEYGFDLHAEKVRGQFIGNVDDDSPAGRSGLRRGDRIVAVNGVAINQENHKDVVKRIKEDPMQCRLVVLDEEGVNWYTEHKLTIPIEGEFVIDVLAEKETNKHHPSIPPPTYNDVVEREEELHHHPHPHPPHHHNETEEKEEVFHKEHLHFEPPPPPVEEMQNLSHFDTPIEQIHHKITPHFEVPSESNGHSFKPRPRLCKLKKTQPSDEYGFNLHAEKGKGHFIGKVDSNSIAERAGLEEGQRIVGVNNTLIYPHTAHKDVVTLIKKDSNLTELLVVFPEIDNWYRGKNMEFSFDDAETVQTEENAHPVHLRHAEINGKTAHVEHIRPHEEVTVVKVAPSLPSHGVDTYPSTHKEIVHEEITHVPVEPKRHSPPAPRAAPVASAHVQSNGGPDLFRLSAAEMRERLSSQKKADPRGSGNLSLKQKYDIIQSL
jgi:hypothetical protein